MIAGIESCPLQLFKTNKTMEKDAFDKELTKVYSIAWKKSEEEVYMPESVKKRLTKTHGK